jgi:hypothetical protein
MTLHPQPELRTLAHRNELGGFLNKRGLTGKFVEVGTLHGGYASEILKTWKGHLYCVDPWRNQEKTVYNDQANDQDMDAVWAEVNAGIGRNPNCTLIRMMGLNAVGKFADGELDGVYIDANHAVGAVRDDIAAWWPKVKIGGIVSGHDFFMRYDDTGNCDAMTAVLELCEAIGVRVHVTWCSSWWIVKTELLDLSFKRVCAEGLLERSVYTDNRNLDMVVVVPVAKFDWNLAVKMLTHWAALLGGYPNNFTTVAWCSTELSEEQRDTLWDSGLPNLCLCVAKDVQERGYFGTPNPMFRTALEYVEKNFPGKAMLWVEADAVPMRRTWAQEILEEYRGCSRPFMGDICGIEDNVGIPHLTGNAVYHPDWRKLAPSLAKLGSERCGWDALCAHDLVPRSHYSKTIQQTWRPPLPITAAWAKANIRPSTALFHQCKDGSLIDVLCAASSLPAIPLAKPLAVSTYETDRCTCTEQVNIFKPKTSHPFSPSIPIHVSTSAMMVEILIVTHAKDMDFLHYCLESINKFAAGFTGITLVVPFDERNLFNWVGSNVKLRPFKQIPGKGIMHHVLMKCHADELCPSADAILHMDADCVVKERMTPSDYIPNGRPIIVRQSFNELASLNQNRMIWQENAVRALGFSPEYETMVRHPNVYLRSLYPLMRSKVEEQTKQKFDDYALSGRETFPQSFQEFITLGAVAIKYCPNQYTFVDYDRSKDDEECGVDPKTSWQYLYRKNRDRILECWSHGGIAKYKDLLEKVIKGNAPDFIIK